jgi:type III pantothenate kinase
MKVDIVADVGNSLIKWGFCFGDWDVEKVSLPPSDPESWTRQLALWDLTGPLSWAVTGVHPQRRDELADWARQRGDTVWLLESTKHLPLRVALPYPEKVGIDRLLNAVAARGRVLRKVPLILIDAGTAVTVDWVDRHGRFRGGAILPGLRLMAQALHDYTALLPRVQVTDVPNVPGTTTESAIQAGVFWAVAGGIKGLQRLLGARVETQRRREIFLTGGDAALLAPVMDPQVIVWPNMTLEGIRLCAEAQP